MNWSDLLAFASGPAILILWLIYYSKTHKQQISKELKTGQKNVPYSQKLPANYTPAEKRWALYTVIMMVTVFLIACYFLFALRSTTIASGSVFVGIILWRIMINFGDKYTKNN